MDEDNQPSSSSNGESTNQLNLDQQNYSIFKLIKNMVNNKDLSDVSFLVGEDKTLIHSHKMILTLGSPVFRKMFNSEFEQKSDAIEITDITETGFLNMLKYIYGYEIDYDLSELYESYKALDKYLVYGHENKFLEYIQKKLNKSNCFITYDQLVKMKKNDNHYLDFVQSFIQINCSAAFFSEPFLKIDQETLIKLLNLDYLNLDEFSILKACSNWVDYKVRETFDIGCVDLREFLNLKQSEFNKIKNFIKFSELTLYELGWFSKFNLLSTQEIGDLFIWLSNKNNENDEKIDKEFEIANDEASIITCNTKRRSIRPFKIEDYTLFFANLKDSSLSRFLTVNRKISISSISTTMRSIIKSELSVSENLINLDINYKKISIDEKWCFCFIPYLELEPDKKYKLQLRLDSSLESNYFSQKEHFIYSSENYTIDIHLECSTPNPYAYLSINNQKNYNFVNENRFHFVKKIEFLDLEKPDVQ